MPHFTKEQFVGCIVGLAVGDALGYPCEFRTREQIVDTFGDRGVDQFIGLHDPRWPERPIIIGSGEQPPGTFSDDTQMTLAIADGLLRSEVELDETMNAIAKEFVVWSRSPDNNRAPGATCMTGCQNLEEGVPWRDAGVSNSKGCGSAMRVAPIGLVFADDLDAVAKFAAASSVLTHGHPTGIDGAVAAALLVAMALRGESPEKMHTVVSSYCRSPDFVQVWDRVPSVLDQPPESVLVEGVLGEAWVAEEAVASAMYCYWRSPNSFAEVVLAGANTDGDSDSIACIAGSIIGAAIGIDAIPQTWRDNVEAAPRLRETALALFEKRLTMRIL